MKGEIGENAGRIWQYIEKAGKPVTLTNVKKSLKSTPDNDVYLALGWLARENRIDIYKDKRTTYVRLLLS